MRIDDAVRDLNDVTRDVHAAFGGLSGEQLNWKPAPASWSVAQCLDHLIRINRLYFPLLESLARGEMKPTLWERMSPFSGLFGRVLIRSVSPQTTRKMKTTAKAEPSASTIDDNIVQRFAQHQDVLTGHLRRVPPDTNGGTIITSPLLGVVTYSLDDCITIVVNHEQRHVQQAKRVVANETFPRDNRERGLFR
jgi:hypothetical protein